MLTTRLASIPSLRVVATCKVPPPPPSPSNSPQEAGSAGPVVTVAYTSPDPTFTRPLTTWLLQGLQVLHPPVILLLATIRPQQD